MQNVSKGSSVFGAKKSRVETLARAGCVAALEAGEKAAPAALEKRK
jgi:hypothetical protein